jgi:hypothetical protein
VQREQRRGASPEAFEALGQHLVVGGSRARHLGCNTPNSPISAPLANYGLLCAAINQSNRRLTRSSIIHSVSSVNLSLSLSMSVYVCVWMMRVSLSAHDAESRSARKNHARPVKIRPGVLGREFSREVCIRRKLVSKVKRIWPTIRIGDFRPVFIQNGILLS